MSTTEYKQTTRALPPNNKIMHTTSRANCNRGALTCCFDSFKWDANLRARPRACATLGQQNDNVPGRKKVFSTPHPPPAKCKRLPRPPHRPVLLRSLLLTIPLTYSTFSSSLDSAPTRTHPLPVKSIARRCLCLAPSLSAPSPPQLPTGRSSPTSAWGVDRGENKREDRVDRTSTIKQFRI